MQRVIIAKRGYASRNLLRLSERQGFISNFYPRERGHDIAAFLEKDKRTLYAGFDPTASSLHVGHLLVIMGLLHAQKAGHQSLALIGGATARIGDPSGKNSERPSLEKKQVEDYVKGIKKNLRTIFRNFQAIHGIAGPEIVNNADWYEHLNVIDFMSIYGKHYRLTKMLAKDTVKRRLEAVRNKEDPQGGMSLTEFTYQAFQAFDWLHLSQEHNCLVQLGGHDQMGNISAGHDLIKRKTGKDAFGLLLPLITGNSGQKLGKTEGNAVWLSGDLTTPFDLYQYFIRIPDDRVEQMLHYFTFLSIPEIDELIKAGKKRPEKRLAQQRLATEVTKLVHGQNGLENAQRTTEIFFSTSDSDVTATLRGMSKQQMKEVFPSAPYCHLIYQSGMTILDFAVKLKIFPNEKVAQQIIQAGGFYVNQAKRTNIDEMLVPGDHVLPNGMTLVRTGKRNYVVVDWYE